MFLMHTQIFAKFTERSSWAHTVYNIADSEVSNPAINPSFTDVKCFPQRIAMLPDNCLLQFCHQNIATTCLSISKYLHS